MDIIGFLNDVTGGELLLWKVIATTVVFALAGLQVIMAARFWGVATLPGVSAKSAAAVHRTSGRIAIVLAVIVAVSCIAGPAGPTSPTRVLLHSVFGTLVFGVLIAKFLILKVLKKGDKALPFVGISLFLVFGAIWATTVADYISHEVTMRVLRLLTAVAVVALSAALVIAPATAQQKAKTATVKMVDFEFATPEVTVDVGTVVTWSNDGDHPHTATDRGGTFDTDPVAPNGDASVTFSVPGTYSYFCRINPSKMNGTLVVKAGTAPSPVNRIQAFDPAREGEQLRFDPKELTVPTGSQIVFANVGGKPHTLTADASDPAFDSGVVTPGAEGGRFAGANVSISLPEPGQFAFHCEIHPQAMTGVLNVVGKAKKPPAAVSTAARQVTVDMKGIRFQPEQVSVTPGGKVTWKNFDSAPHDAKFDQNDVIPQTKLLQRGDSASITAPDAPGSYAYICSVHPSMTGVIVVVGQNTGDPSGVATARPAAAVGGGPGGGVTSASLITGILGAFLGGFGIAAFVTRRRTKAAA